MEKLLSTSNAARADCTDWDRGILCRKSVFCDLLNVNFNYYEQK